MANILAIKGCNNPLFLRLLCAPVPMYAPTLFCAIQLYFLRYNFILLQHNAQSLAARSAARTVFATSMVMVIGPTPPGTGVIQPATSFAESKSTSPHSLPSGRRLMPTSITAAPGLIMSPVIILALPVATTRMSASRVYLARSTVLEVQMVTVAFCCSSISAIGLPTMLLRPTPTACLPSMDTPHFSNSFIAQYGVQGAKRMLPMTSP